MLNDGLVKEVRKARQEQGTKWNFDLQAILADARKRLRLLRFDGQRVRERA